MTKTKNISPDWQVMVYMNFSEDLVKSADANIRDMKRHLTQNKKIQLILWKEHERRKSKTLSGKRNGSNLRVSENGELVEKDDKKINHMDDTFGGFMQECFDNYPAKKRMLVIWGHGGGIFTETPTHVNLSRNKFQDDTPDELHILEIRSAIFNAQKIKSKTPFDIIAIDSCLMGLVDTVYELNDCCDFLVFSQNSISDIGLNYDNIMQLLSKKPAVSPAMLSKTIVDSYVNRDIPLHKISLSVIKTKPRKFFEDFKKLIKLLEDKIDTYWEEVMVARSLVNVMDPDVGYMTVDFGDFLTQLKNTINNAERESEYHDRSLTKLIVTCDKSFRKIVFHNKGLIRDIDGTFIDDERQSGMAIFFPENGYFFLEHRFLDSDSRDNNFLFFFKIRWYAFLEKYYQKTSEEIVKKLRNPKSRFLH